MKLRDNLALVPVVAIGLSLELFILLTYLLGGTEDLLQLEAGKFLVLGHLYLLGACAFGYVAGRILIRPLEDILRGIALFGGGRWDHRIGRSKIREFDRLAEQLNAMAARMAELDTLKNDLVANVSHELRSPLAAMEGYVNLLLERSKETGRQHENLLRLNSNLARLRRLVENLLDMARLEARGAEARSEPVDLPSVAREVCALFSMQLEARSLCLDAELSRGLPEALGDPAKVRQVLHNLVDNAVKYNRPGGTVRVRARRNHSKIQLSIEDTGHGIAAEHLETIFERFRRAPASPKTAQVKGVGLGLAISRGLAREMGGDLTVESAPDVGSTFTFSLPMREPR